MSTEYHHAICCDHPDTGAKGVSWIFTGSDHRKPGTSISPAFADCLELFDWMAANGYKTKPGTYLDVIKATGEQ